MVVAGWETEPPFACSAGNEGKVAFRPGEWKGLSSRISSEIRQRATFFAREGVRGGNRGVAYIPRLEVVGAIEVEHLRPVVFPFNQNQFSLDKRLGATKNLEGGKVRRTSGEPLSKYHAFPIGACHRGCGPKTCLERLARKGPSEKTSLTRKRSPPSVRRIRKLP